MTEVTTTPSGRDPSGVSRRCFVHGATAAGVLALAACSPGADRGTTAPSAGAGGDGDGIVALADVPVGGAVAATLADGTAVVVAQPAEGTVVVLDAACTHQRCTVGVDGDRLLCPCHGSVFDLETGENLEGPAPAPLAQIPAEVRDGRVVPT